LLGEGAIAAEKWIGAKEARYLVEDRPQAVLVNQAPDSIPMPPALTGEYPAKARSERKRGRLFQWLSVRR
jgi:protein-tyrosine phosphatase